MKRILTLLLAACLVLGLSATAFATDTLTFSNMPSGVLGRNYDASFDIAVIPHMVAPERQSDVDSIIYELSSTVGQLTGSGTSYSLAFNTRDILSSKKITFTLKTTVNYISTPSAPDVFTQYQDATFTIAPAPPTLNSNNITISCTHGAYNPTGSGPFSFSIPVACISAGHNLTISVTGVSTSDFDISFPLGATIPSSQSSGQKTITVTNKVTTGTADSTTATINISHNTSTNVNLASVTLKAGTETVASSGSSNTSSSNTSSSTPTVLTAVTSTNASTAITVTVSATANDSNANVSIANGSFTLSSGASADFSVTITAPSGAPSQTYYYRVTRSTASTNANLTRVDVKTSASATGNLDSRSGNGSTNTATATALTVPYDYSSVVIVPVKADNAATVSVYSGHSTTGSGSTTLTLNNLVPGTAQLFTVKVVPQSGTTAYYYYKVTRQTSKDLLKSVIFTYNGEDVGKLTNLSGPNSGTTVSQNLSLNTNASSAILKWVLADGATLSSASWGGTALTSAQIASAQGNGYSAGLPASGSRALILKIYASNGTLYTATINVSTNTTATNKLSSLYIKDRITTSTNDNYLFSTSPSSFNSNTTNYTVYVNDDTDNIYIYPTAASSGASVTVSGTYDTRTDRYNSDGYFIVKLRSGSNTVNVNVAANNTTTTYKLTIEREANVVQNASLDTLYVSKSSTSTTSSNRYTLDPSFSYKRTSYDVDLAKSVSEVYLHFSTYKSNATVSVSNATKVSDGVYKATLTANKTKAVTITVKYSGDDTKYTINLNSGNASTRAQLSRIRVASQKSSSSSYQYTLLPDFDSTVTDYVALIPYESSGSYAYVQATLDDSDDTLRVDGDIVESGDWVDISINRGKSVSVPIKVTDDDGNTTTYDLKIVAAARNADDDALLDSLSLRTSSSTSSAINLSPSFSSSTTKYTAANVANSTSSLRVYAEPSDSGAWVIVNNVLMTGSYAEVDLDEGSNTISVQVYAADCETHKTYTITVNRGASGSLDSTLSGLEARYGTSSGQTLNLIPAFDKSTTSYRINVDGSVAQIAFRPTATDSGATIRIMGKDEVSGQWTSYNSLNSGSNSFIITVTSGDGTKSSYYTVTVERGLTVVVSAQKMQVNGKEVNCAAYNINGNNYFKLRDIAYALRGTTKNFDVTYNSTNRVITMTSGRNYSIIGGEMVKPVSAKKYQLSNQTVVLDGRSINLTAYNVDGNNYFMLREIGQLFNFGVDFVSGTNTVLVDSSKVYTPE